ncbi:PcfJ domain-containing protein [Flavobacterium sp. ST-87]|uniref:PcfJ domain-containing protein n=1 Tax=Flavobacterium plantiphilum TaxID=3163297 RepID=A0ABW8XX55_9FLAO
MIPKTKIEKEITALSASLTPINTEMKKWAEQNIFLKWAALSRGKFHCLECAHSWKPDTKNTACQNFTKCTACNCKLKMFQYNQVHFHEIEYSAVLDTKANFQVVRIICSYKEMKKNCMPTYTHKEVMQHWINAKGETRSLSLSTNLFSQAYDAWKLHSTLEIRPKSFLDTPKYTINPYKVFPKMKILPILKRNGFKSSCYKIAPQLLFVAILSDSIAETLLKSGQTAMLYYYIQTSRQRIKENWKAVKTYLKHHYIIEDYDLWFDYIELLHWFKKDLCNPALVCPENLHQLHDKLVLKKRTIQHKQYLEKMRAEIAKAQASYTEEKKTFFGLTFSNENLKIAVLENVQDFLKEGDALHHCLFTNEYFKKKDSLIFSARMDDTPIETIEVSLSKMKIVQCRGLKNKNSKQHKMILNLMKKNLYQIRNRIKKNKTVK